MGERVILQKGDPALTKVCRPVTEFNHKLHILLDDMKETLTKAEGYGLAAPQVGILRRAVVLLNDEEQPVELINPVILAQSGSEVDYEGCLSLSGLYGLVERPTEVTVRAQDRDGNFFEITGHGVTARCMCHELEHLDGHLFDEHTDRLITGEEMQREREAQEKAQEAANKGKSHNHKKKGKGNH